MLNRATWIWDGSYDDPFINSTSLDIEVQEFEPLPGKEHNISLISGVQAQPLLPTRGFMQYQ
jgi:hypothetical protein